MSGVDKGATLKGQALVASDQAASRLDPSGFDPSRDECEYDFLDDVDCWNCGGDGFVLGCSWDWQCDTYDAGEGTCLCTRPCHICHPPKHDPELRRVMAEALASGIEAQSDETPTAAQPEGQEPDPKGTPTP